MFCQTSVATGSSHATIANQSAQPTTSSQPLVLCRPSRSSAAPTRETPVLVVLHLIDESSPINEDSVPLKRGRVDVGDGAVRATKSIRGDRELTVVVSEGDVNLSTVTSLSTGVMEDIPFPEVAVKIRGPSEAMDAVLRNESSSLGPVDVPSLAEERSKGIVEDGYETSSDVDPEEVRRFNKGFTQVDVRLEGSSCTIVIPMDLICW